MVAGWGANYRSSKCLPEFFVTSKNTDVTSSMVREDGWSEGSIGSSILHGERTMLYVPRSLVFRKRESLLKLPNSTNAPTAITDRVTPFTTICGDMTPNYILPSKLAPAYHRGVHFTSGHRFELSKVQKSLSEYHIHQASHGCIQESQNEFAHKRHYSKSYG